MGKKRIPIRFGGLSNTLAQSKIQQDRCYASANCITERGILEGGKRYTQIAARSGAHASDVCYGAGYGKYTGNEVQKITPGGTISGGTWTITWGAQTTGNIAYDADAETIQVALEALSNINLGDIRVYPNGGADPTSPNSVANKCAMLYEWRGQYANADQAAMTTNVGSLTGSSPTMTVSEERKGGTHEWYVCPIKNNGDSTATLYKITSSDEFATGTYASIATGLSATDWHFEQFQDSIYGANAVDGLIRIILGGAVELRDDTVAPPTRRPTIAERRSVGAYTNTQAIDFSSGSSISASDSNVLATSTIDKTSGYSIVVSTAFGGAGTPSTITTVEIDYSATQDWSANDNFYMDFRWDAPNIFSGIGSADIEVAFINGDGSPLTIAPYKIARNQGGAFDAAEAFFSFIGTARNLRDNIDKIQIRYRIGAVGGTSGDMTIRVWKGDNWLNDAVPIAGTTAPKVDSIEYAYTYFDISAAYETPLSPIGKIDSIPSVKQDWGDVGSYNRLTVRGSADLLTTDLIYIYRKQKSTGLWKRLPNLAGTQGIANVTSGTTTFDDHYWEFELDAFPVSTALNATGHNPEYPEQIGAWKESLVLGQAKKAYISMKGNPTAFAPAPEDITPEDVARLDEQGIGQAVTEYVSPNRSEDMRGIVGADALYCATDQGTYVKIGDFAFLSPLYRRLLGSRGATSTRSSYSYQGGILVGTKHGLWYYETTTVVGTGGQVIPREEELTSEVRESWNRLQSQVTSYVFTGSGLTSYTITVNGQTTGAITPGTAGSTANILAALEALSNVLPGDVAVWYNAQTSTTYIRFGGQFVGTAVTVSVATTGGTSGATVATASTAGLTSLFVTEHDDELWCVNSANYLVRSRTGEWHEGQFTSTMKCGVSNRARGLHLFTATGKMNRIKPGQTTDNGTAVAWSYETAMSIGPRMTITGIECSCVGTPLLNIVGDDGSDSTVSSFENVYSLDAGKYRQLSVNNLPGHKLRATMSGIVGTDYIEDLAFIVEERGDGYAP